MADLQINCVNLSYYGQGHEHITHAGGRGWRWTVEQIVTSIRARAHSFYVLDQWGNRANVGVVEPVGRRPYIRTYRDGVPTDNLLSLLSCPV